MLATMKPIKVVLPCQMTTEDFASKSQERLDWANDQARREAAIKALKDMHKLPIKLAKDKQEELRETLNTKTVAREVDCFQVFNWETGMTHQRRGDTGEMVPGTLRKMTKNELQMDNTQAAAPAEYLLIENCPEAEVVETNPVSPALALPAPTETSELQDEAVDGEIDSIEKEDDGFEIVEDSIDSPETESIEADIMDFEDSTVADEELF